MAKILTNLHDKTIKIVIEKQKMTFLKRLWGQQFSKPLDFIIWKWLLLPFIIISLVKEVTPMKEKTLEKIYETAV